MKCVALQGKCYVVNGNYFLMKKGQLTLYKRYIIQLSPEGEVNIVVYIPRRGCHRIYQISLLLGAVYMEGGRS